MKNKNYLETDFLDIIFQGRNKAYGAYYIRKTYAQRVKKSLFTLMLLVTVGIISVSFKPIPDPSPDKPEWVRPGEVVPIELPKDAGKHLAGVIPVVPEKPQKNKPTEIVSTADVEDSEPIEDPEPIDDPTPIVSTTTGPVGEGPIGTGGTETGGVMPGTGGGEAVVPAPTPDPEPDPEPVPFVETMPKFPGGDDALRAFLKDNIKYPKLARRIGTHGRVVLEFVVDKNGNISSITVAKGIGAGCDQEAIRVVNKMPQWSPGVQMEKRCQ